MPIQQVYLIRHGETEWSLSGQHTGTTDIPLTENGRSVARLLQPVLTKESFALVLTSPLQRARETCELAGLGECAEIDRDLMEWNYGEYEGLTPQQIHAKRPWVDDFHRRLPGWGKPRAGWGADRSCDRQGPRRRGPCGPVRARPCAQSLCGAVARPSSRGWRSFPPRHGDAEHPELLSGYPRREAVECSARPVRHRCLMKLKAMHTAPEHRP